MAVVTFKLKKLSLRLRANNIAGHLSTNEKLEMRSESLDFIKDIT